MRIIIELDGTPVETIDVRSAEVPGMIQEPPPELLAAARALGAQSAGIAAFSKPAGIAEAVGAMPAALADLDAGAVTGDAADRRPPAKKPRARAGRRDR
jgi:hypothetical protein